MNSFDNLLNSYKKKLTNLTGNNKSLLLLKLNKDAFIDFKKLDFSYNQQSCSDVLEGLVLRKFKIPICSAFDSRDASSNQLSKDLAKIKRKDTFVFEENGSKNLCFGYPIIEGQLLDKSFIRAPLVFFPIELLLENIKGKPTWFFSLIPDEFPYLNKNFLLAYSHFNKISLDKNLYEFVFEENFESLLDFKNKLYSVLKFSNIDINFNSDLFSSNFEFFQDYTKQDIDFKTQSGVLKLLPQAVMGIFPESSSIIEQDYDFLLNNTQFTTLEEYFESKSIITNAIKEENIVATFDIDASQEDALCKIKSGKSIVVQGPPGTGKSQLICNIISDFLSNNKKVLVVCQKRVALDVVYNRLKTIELSNFSGLIHDHKFDRKDIYNLISTQIENIDNYQIENNSLDTITLEREFLSVSRQIQNVCIELDTFKFALFHESDYGISAKKLYLEATISTSFNANSDFYATLDYQKLQSFVLKLLSIIPYSKIIENNDFPLKNRVSFSAFTLQDKSILLSKVDNLFINFTSYKFTNTYLLNSISFFNLYKLYDSKSNIIDLRNLLLDKNVFNYFLIILENDFDVLTLKKELDAFNSYVSKTNFEVAISSHQLQVAISIIEKTITLCTNIFTISIWELFSKNKQFIYTILEKNNLIFSVENLHLLLKLLQNRVEVNKKFSKTYSKFQFESDISFFNINDINIINIPIYASFDAILLFNTFKNELSFDATSRINHTDFLILLHTFVNSIENVNSDFKEYYNYFTTQNIAYITNSESNKINFIKVINSDFENIIAYDNLLNNLSPVENKFFLFHINNTSNLDSIVSNIQNEAYNYWIYSLEKKYSILTSCSTLKLQLLEENLQILIREKKLLSTKILLLKIKEITYKDIEFNRLNNRISYRELLHQTTKKRQIWPIRKTFDTYSNELLNLIPCWLASPETVSAIFPQNQIFDLVICDEASQCFAEKGFAATIRAKQVCIVGDDKQLAPNDLYQVRYDDTENENSDSELDSLLFLSKKYLPSTMLTYHYRSKNFNLIKFSNEVFYKNKLQFIPFYLDSFNESNCIEYVKLSGIWDKNTNFIEAEYIVNLIIKLQNFNPNINIGVVTFNAKQQQLIEDLIYEKSLLLLHDFPSSLFIKNIENVQGDERDIIIFSIGYAPDITGKMSMSFGSLNMPNGENRLNVALTRAKEKIYLITSILPQQLFVENALNSGPKLLKKYLEFAYNLNNSKENTVNTGSKNSSISLANKLIVSNSNIMPFNYSFADAHEDNVLLLTDDTLFYESLSSKDFFAYHPLNLTAKNWKFKRIFSRNFWLNPQNFNL